MGWRSPRYDKMRICHWSLIYVFVFVVSSCFHSKARTYFYAYATKGHMKGTIAHSPHVSTLEVSFGDKIYGTWAQSSSCS